MKIYFGLDWITSGKNWRKTFKSAGAYNLFEDYLSRISHFAPADAGPVPEPEALKGKKLWICDTSASAKMLSSEDLAKKLSLLQDSGTKEWVIVIGGSDGFTAERLKALSPDLRWNFGPMTLPHELAAAVASEQIYRAWTILRHLPYHKDH